MLHYRADIQSIFTVVIYYIVVTLAFLQFDQLGTWQVAMYMVALFSLCWFCSVITHNTVHHAIFKSKWPNKIFQYFLSFAQGHPVSAFTPGHNFSHHKHTNLEKDIMRSSIARFRWNFLNQALFFFIALPGIIDSENRWAARMKKENRAWFNQWLAETVVVYGLKITLTIVNWQAAILLIWLPHLWGNWGIVGTNMWQHDGTDPHHKYNHSRSVESWWFNFFNFNNGYHTAHHMFPHVHWSLLPKYHHEFVAPHLHENLRQKSLLGYLWRANVWPGQRLDYLGKPLEKPEKMKSLDWVEEVDINDPKNRYDYGAEDMMTKEQSKVTSRPAPTGP